MNILEYRKKEALERQPANEHENSRATIPLERIQNKGSKQYFLCPVLK